MSVLVAAYACSVIYMNERACCCICMPHACIYIHAYACMDERITLCGPAQHTCTLVRPCARARVCVCLGARVSAPKTCEPFPSAMDRVRLGSQAFGLASAFNANIGAWNTASVAVLSGVRAQTLVVLCCRHGHALHTCNSAAPLHIIARPFQSYM